jgi:hypothetical protein
MKYPKILSALAIDSRTLLLEFDNKEKKKYDITPLLKREIFFPLKNSYFFKAVKVDQGGYAVVWDSNIDLSEYELWRNGQPVS